MYHIKITKSKNAYNDIINKNAYKDFLIKKCLQGFSDKKKYCVLIFPSIYYAITFYSLKDTQLSYLKNMLNLYPKSGTYSSSAKVSLPYNGQCFQGKR